MHQQPLRRSVAGIVGRAPIHPILFALSKLASLVSLTFLAAYAFGAVGSPEPVLWLRRAALALLTASGILVVAAFVTLGESARVGLPLEPTRLKTTGAYNVSRNPMYLSLFMACTASCLLVPHSLNVASALIAIVLHDRIVRAEERFLEQRFGEAWRQYRSRVRRYL